MLREQVDKRLHLLRRNVTAQAPVLHDRVGQVVVDVRHVAQEILEQRDTGRSKMPDTRTPMRLKRAVGHQQRQKQTRNGTGATEFVKLKLHFRSAVWR
jgi:hypothetical protein